MWPSTFNWPVCSETGGVIYKPSSNGGSMGVPIYIYDRAKDTICLSIRAIRLLAWFLIHQGWGLELDFMQK